VWVEDLRNLAGFGRAAAAAEHGLRCVFGFPVIVRGVVVAIMEVFSEEVRAQDSLTMGAAQSIASQLARIVERESAHRENARTAAIVESSLDAIFSRSLDGTIRTWNPGAERLFGYAASEIVGRNVSMIIPPELRPNMASRREQLAHGLPIFAHETVRITRDGRRIHVSTSSTPIRDANGEIWGVAAIVRDITERKHAERELRQVQQHLQVAVSGGGVGLYDWNVLTGAVYFSPEWKRQLGYEERDLPNDYGEWEGRIHPDDRARLDAALQAYLANPAIEYQQEYRLLHRDGSYRWILSRASAQLGSSGNVERMYGCHVDITDQKRAETLRLEMAGRQRDALVREVHHRIKNSLQGVVGLLGQKIRKHPALASEIEEMMGQLQSVALVYGLQETRPDGLLSVTRILDAIISSAEELIGGRVDRVIERQSRRPACLTGSEAVSVAFALNELIFNALKHQRAAAGRKRATISVREMKDAVEIRIRNRGKLPMGFDFSRGRGIGNGLGLVGTLLSAPGSTIVFNEGRDSVEVALELRPPLLVARQNTTEKSGNGITERTGKTARPLAGSGRRPAGARRAV
jgi:PAS domain S-box-containing protein